jgi:hypothetical protein
MKKKMKISELEVQSFVTSMEQREQETHKGGNTGTACPGTYEINCTYGFVCTGFCLDSRLCG